MIFPDCSWLLGRLITARHYKGARNTEAKSIVTKGKELSIYRKVNKENDSNYIHKTACSAACDLHRHKNEL